jgi:hypothetical protein
VDRSVRFGVEATFDLAQFLRNPRFDHHHSEPRVDVRTMGSIGPVSALAHAETAPTWSGTAGVVSGKSGHRRAREVDPEDEHRIARYSSGRPALNV